MVPFVRLQGYYFVAIPAHSNLAAYVDTRIITTQITEYLHYLSNRDNVVHNTRIESWPRFKELTPFNSVPSVIFLEEFACTFWQSVAIVTEKL